MKKIVAYTMTFALVTYAGLVGIRSYDEHIKTYVNLKVNTVVESLATLNNKFVDANKSIKKKITTLEKRAKNKDLYKKLSKSTVMIYRYDPDNVRESQGSGWFIEDRYIVTNAHVVGTRQNFKVHKSDGKVILASPIYVNEAHDIGILYTSSELGEKVKVGFSGKLEVGDPVITIGSPYGMFNTLGVGHVSGINMGIRLPPFKGLIQINTGILPGNSGGALFNMDGELVGIPFAGRGYSGELGYAIPIDLVRQELLNAITDHQKSVLVKRDINRPDNPKYKIYYELRIYKLGFASKILIIRDNFRTKNKCEAILKSLLKELDDTHQGYCSQHIKKVR